MKNVVAVVLGGGQGTRLRPLTKYRSKPAVPLGGKYRLIDIPISNCLNSGLNRIFVLTQFLSVSLHRHIRGAYRFDNFSGGFVEILAAQQTVTEGTDWYQGTADAVRKTLRYLTQRNTDYVVILSGDQLYRMDFAKMLQTHKEAGADITIAAKPVHPHEAEGLGVMKADDSGQVVGFREKPKTDEELAEVLMDPAWIDARGVESNGRNCLASMGIYIFNRDVLTQALNDTDHHDFGREVFPQSIGTRKVQLHLFDGYWEDIGTIGSFYESNLQLARADAPFSLAEAEAKIYSRPRFLPPMRIDGAQVSSSLIADGCTIGAGSVIENSVIGLRCVIGKNVTIRNSVIMGADFYGNNLDLDAMDHPDPVGLGIADGAVIDRAIIDKNASIGEGARVVCEAGADEASLGEFGAIRDGVLVVEKNASLPAGWTPG